MFLESGFGHSLENLRIHDDAEANRLAMALEARAFAFGDHVFFRAGEFLPRTRDGLELLAHETAHVVQHGGEPPELAGAPVIAPQHGSDERAAASAGKAIAAGGQASIAPLATSAAIHRWPWDDSPPEPSTSSAGEGSIWDSIANAGSSALNFSNSVGKSIGDAESSIFDAVVSHPAAVASAATSLNKDFGGLVDSATGGIASLGRSATEATAGIPILGGLTESGAFLANATAETLGGQAKGLGDLVTGGTVAAANPFAPIQGLLGMAEHTPGFAGTALKGAHGLYDIATGNEKGEYGNSLGSLWDNLSDGDKQNEQDLKFWAGLGGGVDAWSEKPGEAFSRTLTNLAPMILGEFAEGPATGPKGGIEPTPAPPAPEVGPPSQVSPLAKSVPGENLPGVRGPDTIVDPNLPPDTVVDPVSPMAKSVRFPSDTIIDPISPMAESVRGPSDTIIDPISPLAESVRPPSPEVIDPLAPTVADPTAPIEPGPVHARVRNGAQVGPNGELIPRFPESPVNPFDLSPPDTEWVPHTERDVGPPTERSTPTQRGLGEPGPPLTQRGLGEPGPLLPESEPFPPTKRSPTFEDEPLPSTQPRQGPTPGPTPIERALQPFRNYPMFDWRILKWWEGRG